MDMWYIEKPVEGSLRDIQGHAEARPKWQTEAHEKRQNKFTRGVYRMPKVWYN